MTIPIENVQIFIWTHNAKSNNYQTDLPSIDFLNKDNFLGEQCRRSQLRVSYPLPEKNLLPGNCLHPFSFVIVFKYCIFALAVNLDLLC